MSDPGRFERMIRWYPLSWRACYGEELAALLEDTYGMSAVPWRERFALARSGSVERARRAGLLGDSADPNENIRAGSLLVLCAWAFFMLAGGIFAKFTEHWSAATPRTHRGLPTYGYGAVQWAGIVGVVIVLAAAVIVLPAFFRLIRHEGWAVARIPMLRAVLAVTAAIGCTVGVVLWAHHVGPHDGNGGLGSHLILLLWVLSIAAALAFSTAAAVSVARRLDLAPRTMRVLGGLTIGLALIMVLVMAGTLVWWGGEAAYAPGFLGTGALSTSNVVPPPMIIAGVLMLAGLALAVVGVVRVARSLGEHGA